MGIQYIELSRAKETLKIFESNEEIVNENLRNAIVSKELCVAKRKLNDETKMVLLNVQLNQMINICLDLLLHMNI